MGFLSDVCGRPERHGYPVHGAGSGGQLHRPGRHGAGGLHERRGPPGRPLFVVAGDVLLVVQGARLHVHGGERERSHRSHGAGGPRVPVMASYQSVPSTGFVASFWQPPPGPSATPPSWNSAVRSPAYNNYGAWFASRGYPTLDVAYFDAPGLPAELKDIPLEYFAKALRWLARQPGVDPARIWVMGISYGSEAALLLGVHYPHLVHGVAALVPNDLASCAAYVCNGPAWTFGGRPVPYAPGAEESQPYGQPRRRYTGGQYPGAGGAGLRWLRPVMALVPIGQDHHGGAGRRARPLSAPAT